MAPIKRPTSKNDDKNASSHFFLESLLREQSISIRELRVIISENQQILRSLAIGNSRNNQTAATEVSSSLASRTNHSHAIASTVVRVNSSSSRHVVPRTQTMTSAIASYNSTSRNQTIAKQNALVRDSAMPLPRKNICWFHRQFGQNSQSCMPPCVYQDLVTKPRQKITAPPNSDVKEQQERKAIKIPKVLAIEAQQPLVKPTTTSCVHRKSQPAPIIAVQALPSSSTQDPIVSNISETKPTLVSTSHATSHASKNTNDTRMPLERKRLSSSDSSSSSSSSSSDSSAKSSKKEDWNKLAKQSGKSSSGSSSDSSQRIKY